MNTAYQKNPSACTNTLANALSLAGQRGSGPAVSQAVSLAFSQGSSRQGATSAYSAAFAQSKSQSNVVQGVVPYLPATLVPQLGFTNSFGEYEAADSEGHRHVLNQRSAAGLGHLGIVKAVGALAWAGQMCSINMAAG